MILWRARLIVAMLLTMFSPIAATAEDFWSVAVSEHFTTWDFVDAASIALRHDGTFMAWITSVVTGPGASKHAFRKEMKEEIFDCSLRRLAVAQDLTYDNGGSLTAYQNNGLGTRTDVVPGSWGSEELSFVCSSSPQRARNDNWIHIKNSPEEFSDNSYRTYSSRFCSSTPTAGCIVP